VPNTYLWKILQREAVDTSMGAPARGVINALGPVLVDWSGGYLAAVHPSGSFAKGTANRSGTDIDVFVSMRSDCPGSLENIYSTLSRRLRSAGLDVRNQNVSLGTRIHGFDVDVVPARRQGPQGEDHSLWRNRANTWTKTNVAHHIQLVSGSGLQAPIRIMKLWRRQKGLVFPSFYLELAVIEALRNSRSVQLADQVRECLQYFRGSFAATRFMDPANTNNVISDDLNDNEKAFIARAASAALNGGWGDFVK
jgi:hypothetical protein